MPRRASPQRCTTSTITRIVWSPLRNLSTPVSWRQGPDAHHPHLAIVPTTACPRDAAYPATVPTGAPEGADTEEEERGQEERAGAGQPGARRVLRRVSSRRPGARVAPTKRSARAFLRARCRRSTRPGGRHGADRPTRAPPPTLAPTSPPGAGRRRSTRGAPARRRRRGRPGLMGESRPHTQGPRRSGRTPAPRPCRRRRIRTSTSGENASARGNARHPREKRRGCADGPRCAARVEAPRRGSERQRGRHQ